MEVFDFEHLGAQGEVHDSWDYTNLFDDAKDIETIDQDNATQRRFIYAPCGYGKTWFCEFSIYQWSKSKIWTEYEVVLLLKASKINRCNGMTFQSLVEQSVIYNNVAEDNLTLDYLKNLASRKKLLVLLDGIDEIVNFPDEITENIVESLERDISACKGNPQLEGYKLVVGLILGQIIRGTQLVLTTRTDNIKSLWEFCIQKQLFLKAIKILPFKEENVFAYLHELNHKENLSYVDCLDEKCSKMVKLLKSNDSLLRLCSNPCCCMIVGLNQDILAEENAQNLSTTNLITRFLWNILAEHARIEMKSRAVFHNLPTYYKNLLKNVSLLAYELFTKGERDIRGTYEPKIEPCEECGYQDIEITFNTDTNQKVHIICTNKLTSLGLLVIEKDDIKNEVTCTFDQEIGHLRDYFAAAYIVSEDKSLRDVARASVHQRNASKITQFSKSTFLNIHFYDILPIVACMCFSNDRTTESFLEAIGSELPRKNLEKKIFYEDMISFTKTKTDKFGDSILLISKCNGS